MLLELVGWLASIVTIRSLYRRRGDQTNILATNDAGRLSISPVRISLSGCQR
jgi:hypothetical protein